MIKAGTRVVWEGAHKTGMRGVALTDEMDHRIDVQWDGQSLEDAFRESGRLPTEMMSIEVEEPS